MFTLAHYVRIVFLGVRLKDAPSADDPSVSEPWITHVRVARGGEDPFHLKHGLWFTLPYGNITQNSRGLFRGFLYNTESVHVGFSDGDILRFYGLSNFRETGRTVGHIDQRMELTRIDKELGFTFREVVKEIIWPEKKVLVPVEREDAARVIPIRRSS